MLKFACECVKLKDLKSKSKPSYIYKPDQRINISSNFCQSLGKIVQWFFRSLSSLPAATFFSPFRIPDCCTDRNERKGMLHKFFRPIVSIKFKWICRPISWYLLPSLSGGACYKR